MQMLILPYIQEKRADTDDFNEKVRQLQMPTEVMFEYFDELVIDIENDENFLSNHDQVETGEMEQIYRLDEDRRETLNEIEVMYVYDDETH